MTALPTWASTYPSASLLAWSHVAGAASASSSSGSGAQVTAAPWKPDVVGAAVVGLAVWVPFL